jgi:hypothetical protein
MNMAIVTTITEAKQNIGLNTLNNGTNSIQLVCTYPTFDPLFDSTLLEDLYIESLNGFKANEAITVLVNGTLVGDFTIGADTKSIWLSELTGLVREQLSLKITESIQFDFNSVKLLKFISVSATSVNFIPANTVQTSGLGSNMYQLAISDISGGDESDVIAIRDAISGTITEIVGNNTTTIKIKNTYPVWGIALPKTFVMDNLIVFSKLLPMNTEIYIKKDGIPVKTYKTTANIKCIYLSDILGVSKEFLYTKVSEEYELNFVYPQFINNQILTGELIDFSIASVMAVQLQQNIFELENSHTMEDAPVTTNDCNFVVTYSSYDRSIESAELQINAQQTISLSFLTDTSGDIPIPLVKLSNLDNLYNTEISLVMDGNAITDYLTTIRDFARKRNELEYKYKAK